MYWFKHLHEMQNQAKEAETIIKKYATDAIEKMISCVEEHNSGILEVYEDG
jgi:hypothetical protein